VAQLQACARRDQDVLEHCHLVDWFANQDNQEELEPTVEEEDFSPEGHAKLMDLAPNKSQSLSFVIPFSLISFMIYDL